MRRHFARFITVFSGFGLPSSSVGESLCVSRGDESIAESFQVCSDLPRKGLIEFLGAATILEWSHFAAPVANDFSIATQTKTDNVVPADLGSNADESQWKYLAGNPLLQRGHSPRCGNGRAIQHTGIFGRVPRTVMSVAIANSWQG